MRILIANDGLSDAGGVDTYLRAVCSNLQKRGHGVAWIHCGGHATAHDTPASECWSVGALGLERAVAAASTWRPDVCFSHNMGVLAVERALFAIAPVVKMMHGYFGTCVSGLKSFAWPAPRPCSRTLGAACLAMYVPRHCGPLHPSRIALQYRFAIGQRALFARYRAIVVASRHMKEEYVRGGAAEDQVYAIPLFAPAVEHRTAESSVDAPVLFFGRMTTLKGGDLLVRAISEAERTLRRRVPLVMAGDGPERARWAMLAKQLSVNATFPGWIDRDAQAELLARASMVVVPSTWPEPFGLVGLEAAAFGVPSVAFDIGGITEWLSDGVTGLLAGTRPDAAALRDAIVRVLGDHALHARLSGGARRMAQTLTLDRHVDALEPLLEKARGVAPAHA